MAAQEFFNQVYRDARDCGANHIQSAIAAAQSSIETGWGKHVKGNAYFGIKAGRYWKGKTVTFVTHEVIKGKRVKITDKFRAYDNIKDSVRNHIKTIENKWPKTYQATTLADAARGLAHGVHGAYATDPTYVDKVRKTAQKRASAARKAYGGKTAEPKLTKKPIAQKQTKANPKSKILPLFRPKQSDATTLAILDKFAHLMPADRRNDKIKILMVRGYYLNSMGRTGKNDRAIYDDAVFVVSPEGIQPFNGNSDPSAFRKRIASIKAPQAIRYRSGPHGYRRRGGPYPAFRQDSICTVTRDGVGDDTGMFHVNFHRGGINGTSSDGCLTVPPHQWNEFYGLLARLLKKHGQATFYTTLLEYAGDNPPVKLPKKESTEVAKSNGGIIGVAIVTTGGLIASWWDQITTWIGGLF